MWGARNTKGKRKIHARACDTLVSGRRVQYVVSEIEAVDEGKVAWPSVQRTGVGPPQTTGPQAPKISA